ncbi:MAG: DUF5694 domain-containing protein [Bacteroidota bacterium]
MINKVSKKLLYLLSVACTFYFCQPAVQQTDDYSKHFNPDFFVGTHQPKVSILGTFHFANFGGHDYADQYVVNGLDEDRQKELTLLIEKLAAFKPTKIVIERNRITADSLLNRQYQQYLTSDSLPQINDEVYLLAFPLAKAMNLNRIHCADADAAWFGANLDWANFDEDRYLKARNQYEKSYRYNYDEVYAVEDSLKSTLNLLDYYRLTNSSKLQLYNHQIYLTETVLSGAGDNYIGADAVARWYRRNLKIYANVLDFANFEEPDRILIIYGASHIWTLKQFFEDSPDFDYVEINDFLNR